MATTTPGVDLKQVQDFVDRAVRAAVPAALMVERRSRPESTLTWQEPAPAAGVQAALTVVRLAQQYAYRHALGLRGEGRTWREIATLLEIPWSEEYVQAERAYELVLGPQPDGGSAFHRRAVYWTCAGPLGCGKYITDRGPYNGYPVDNEEGHDDGCRRLAADMQAWERWSQERDARNRVMDEALPKVTDQFGRATVERARYVQSHGGRYQGWSTSETLAVALVLRDDEVLRQTGYPRRGDALRRILDGLHSPPNSPAAWLALLRAAATGITD